LHQNYEHLECPEPYAKAYQGWNDIVKVYLACEFTKPADKLVALNGAMKEIRDSIFVLDLFRGRRCARHLPIETYAKEYTVLVLNKRLLEQNLRTGGTTHASHNIKSNGSWL